MLIENGYDKGPGPGKYLNLSFFPSTRVQNLRFNSDVLQDILEYHYDYVKRVVPKDRLNWIELSEGWAPLCKILDKPIPDEPFPRANDSEAVDETARYVFRKTATVWMGLAMALVILCYVGLRAQAMF